MVVVRFATGVNPWLASILQPSQAADQILNTPEVPAALAAIRDAFSLTTVQLAEVIGVSRQAIYDWTDGKPVKAHHRERVARILGFVGEWKTLHSGPMGAISGEEVHGACLLRLLCADPLDPAAVSDVLVRIATKLGEREAIRPRTARELAALHGTQPLSEEAHRRNLQTARLRFGRKG